MNFHDPEEVTAYALGLLDGPASSAMEAHLATCADCRREWAQVRATADLLATLPPETFADGPPAGDLALRRALRRIRDEDTAPRGIAPRGITPQGVGPQVGGPQGPGPQDTGPQQVGPPGAGPQRVGPQETGPQQVRPQGTGPQQVRPPVVGPQGIGPEGVGPQGVGPQGLGPQGLGPQGIGPQPVGPQQLGPQRGRRRSGLGWQRGIAAAAAALVLLGGGAVVGRLTAPAPAPVVVAGRTVEGTAGSVRMSATITPANGWVRLAATVSGIRPGLRCLLVVVGPDGKDAVAGSWLTSVPAVPGRPGTVNGSTIIDPAQVRAVAIRTDAGETIISVPVPGGV